MFLLKTNTNNLSIQKAILATATLQQSAFPFQIDLLRSFCIFNK